MLNHQSIATFTIIIAEDNIDGLELTRVASAEHLMDIGQVCVRELSGERRHCLDEVEGSRPRARISGRWKGQEEWSGIISSQLVRPTGVTSFVIDPKLA